MLKISGDWFGRSWSKWSIGDRRRTRRTKQHRKGRGPILGEAVTDKRKSSPRLTDSPSFPRPCNINIRETRMQYTTRRDSRAQEYHESSGSTSRDESRQASRKSKFFTSASSTNLQLILHLFYAHVFELLQGIHGIFTHNKLDLFVIHFPLV